MPKVKIFSVAILAILVFTPLSSCQPSPTTSIGNVSSDIEVISIEEKQSISNEITQVKVFDQCESASPSKARILFNAANSKTSGQELELSAGVSGQVGVSQIAQAGLEGAIKKKFVSGNGVSDVHEEEILLEVPGRVKQEHTVVWRETRREGKVTYIEAGQTKSADYSYRIGVELDSSTAKDLPCPGQSSESLGVVPETKTPQGSKNEQANQQATQPIVLPTNTPEVIIAKDINYRADWSSGLNEWRGDNSWKALNGMLINDGQKSLSKIVVPVNPGENGITDYAVEAEVQIVEMYFASFGFAVRSGYYAGVFSGNFPYTAFVSTYIPEHLATDFGDLAYYNLEIDNNWHTYRVEVQGNQIRMFFDGGEVIEVMDNRFLEGGEIELWSSQAQINIRSFKVEEMK